MAVITTIDGIPLYTTIQEALQYAATNGLSGYHTHTYQGQTGYMGGATHDQAVDDLNSLPQNVTTITSSIVNNSGGGY
tara:strand:+ start:4443 stop:4676 length:234 start_codon:yes stop_codon:yes gene_type:complete